MSLPVVANPFCCCLFNRFAGRWLALAALLLLLAEGTGHGVHLSMVAWGQSLEPAPSGIESSATPVALEPQTSPSPTGETAPASVAQPPTPAPPGVPQSRFIAAIPAAQTPAQPAQQASTTQDEGASEGGKSASSDPEAVTLPAYLRFETQEVLQLDPQTVLQLVANRSLDVAIADTRVRQAQGGLVSSVAQLLPSLQLQYFVERFDGGTIVFQERPVDILRTTHIPQITFSYELPLGGRTLYRVHASRKRLQSEKLNRDYQYQQSMNAGLKLYFTVLRDMSRVRLSHQSLQEAKELVRFHEVRLGQGFSKKLDVQQSLAQLAERENQLISAENDLALSKVRLATLLNLPMLIDLLPAQAELKPLDFVDETVTLAQHVQTAHHHRSDLQALQRDIEEARANFGQARSDLLPTVSLSTYVAGIGPSTNELSRIQQAGATISLDVLRHLGVDTVGRLKVARAVVDETALKKTLAFNRIRETIAEAFYAFQANRRAYNNALKRMEAAAQTVAITQAREKLGFGINLEVIQAQTTLAQARLEVQTTLLEDINAQLDLLLATGQLTDQRLAPVLAPLAMQEKPENRQAATQSPGAETAPRRPVLLSAETSTQPAP